MNLMRITCVLLIVLAWSCSNKNECQKSFDLFISKVENVEFPSKRIDCYLKSGKVYQRDSGMKLYISELSKLDQDKIELQFKNLDLTNTTYEKSYSVDLFEIYATKCGSDLTFSIYNDELNKKLDILWDSIMAKCKNKIEVNTWLPELAESYIVIPKKSYSPKTRSQNFLIKTLLMTSVQLDTMGSISSPFQPLKRFELAYLNDDLSSKIESVEISEEYLRVNYSNKSFYLTIPPNFQSILD